MIIMMIKLLLLPGDRNIFQREGSSLLRVGTVITVFTAQYVTRFATKILTVR